MHAKSNTGPRRFIVCDFDEPSPEQHPAIIMHLSKFRPLTMALSSGGKGLHAWFPTTTSIEDDRLFWRLCIGLGADPACSAITHNSSACRTEHATTASASPSYISTSTPPHYHEKRPTSRSRPCGRDQVYTTGRDIYSTMAGTTFRWITGASRNNWRSVASFRRRIHLSDSDRSLHKISRPLTAENAESMNQTAICYWRPSTPRSSTRLPARFLQSADSL